MFYFYFFFENYNKTNTCIAIENILLIYSIANGKSNNDSKMKYENEKVSTLIIE